jgi:hypothetical protein
MNDYLLPKLVNHIEQNSCLCCQPISSNQEKKWPILIDRWPYRSSFRWIPGKGRCPFLDVLALSRSCFVPRPVHQHLKYQGDSVYFRCISKRASQWPLHFLNIRQLEAISEQEFSVNF